MKYHALLFDVNGTLVQDAQIIYLAVKETFRNNVQSAVTKKELFSHFGKGAKVVFTHMLRKRRKKADMKKLVQGYHDSYQRQVQKRKLVAAATIAMVKRLRKKYKMGLVTSNSKKSITKLTGKAFIKEFEAAVYIEDVKKHKPHPDPFLECAKRLKVKPSDCLVIGDTINDARGAKAAKMDFVGVDGKATALKELKKHGSLHNFSKVTGVEKWLEKSSRA